MPPNEHQRGGLGLVVRSRRLSLGLNQDVLATAAGVGTRFVVELEAGKHRVQLGKVLTECLQNRRRPG